MPVDLHAPLSGVFTGIGSENIVGAAMTTTNATNSIVPLWDESPSSFSAFELKAKMYKLGTKKDERQLLAARVIQRMPIDSHQFKICSVIDEAILSAEDGSDLDAILTRLKRKKASHTVHEAV